MSIIPTLQDSLAANDVRRFICRLRYNVATQDFYSRSQGKSVDGPRDLHLALHSPHDYNSHAFRDLNIRVNRIETPLFDPVKQVWNQFYKSVQGGKADEIWDGFRIFSSSFPTHREQLRDLADTDLVPCENVYIDPHPLPNALLKSEVEPLLKRYSDFIQLIQIDSSQMAHLDPGLFKEQVKRDVRMLLSVPLGRQLIDRIMAKVTFKTKITIAPADRFKYNHPKKSKRDPDTHRIKYSIDPAFFYQELPGVGLRSLTSPPFIVLAHELLHMVHMMEGTFHHDLNPLLDLDLETNEEERHVIRNLKCCSKHEPDPCNEETLRAQLGLPVRFTHLAGCKPSDPPDVAYVTALKVGAKMDVEAAFERGVSGPVVAQHMHILSPGTVDKFREIAARKPECRIGPFHPGAGIAGPVIKVPKPVRAQPIKLNGQVVKVDHPPKKKRRTAVPSQSRRPAPIIIP